jgi:hypothetical protein
MSESAKIKPAVTRLFRCVTAVTVICTLTALSSVAAAEEPTAVAVDTTGYDQQMADLRTSYSSMTSAMTAYYAANRGQAFGAFLADNPNALSRLSGTNSGGNLNNLLSQASVMKDPSQLDALLIQNGIGLDVNSWNSLGNAAADLQAKSQSLDAAVVSAGISWASALGMLAVPSVKSPGIPAVDTTLATSMPQEGLAFGLFLNRSLATLIGNFPDVFAQVRSTGVVSPSANAKWRSAMQAAGGASFTQLRNVVGTSACGTAFVNGLTGVQGSGCSPCTIAGMYGNAQLQLALDPSRAATLPGVTNPVLGAADLAELTPQQRAVAAPQNQTLGRDVDEALAGGPSGCSAAAPVVVDASGRSLPKVIDFIAGR